MNESQLKEAVERMISHYVYGLQTMLIVDLMRNDYDQFSPEYIINGEYYHVDSPDGNNSLSLTRTQLDELIDGIKREIEHYGDEPDKVYILTHYLDHLNRAEPNERMTSYWIHVEEWFADKLIKQGEIVLKNDYGCWWSKGAGEMKENDAIIAITKEVIGYANTKT